MSVTPADSDFWKLQKENKFRFKILLVFLFIIYSATFYFVFASSILIFGFQNLLYAHDIKNIFFNIWFITAAPVAGLLLTFFQYSYSNKNGFRTMIDILKANKPDPEDFYHKQVLNIIDEIKIASGRRSRIDVVILPMLAKNVFCADICGLKLIGLTEGLIFKFSRDEIQALLAQQFTHLINGDAELISFICSTHSFFNNIAEGCFHEKTNGLNSGFLFCNDDEKRFSFGLNSVMLFLVVSAAGAIIKFSNVIISRNREFFADLKAVEYTRNPLALANALYKIGKSGLSKNLGLHQNLSALFIAQPDCGSINEKTGFFYDLFSTHPPLKERINELLKIAGVSIKHFYFEKERGDYLKLKRKTQPTNQTLDNSAESIDNQTNEQNQILQEENSYYVFNKDNWEGPFKKDSLYSLQYLMPDSFINIAGSQTVGKLLEVLPEFSYLSNKSSETKCPRCGDLGGSLISIKYEYAPVEKCRRCQGYLIDTDKIIRILNRNIQKFSTQQIKSAESFAKSSVRKLKKVSEFDDSKLLLCPKCGQKMIRCFFNYMDYVVVDRCLVCNLTWFDNNELELIQYFVEKRSSEIC
ncbi:MAG TPA: M48 family metalloprotease [bacterium]|nr:M48 family metalloprotease [bacterium]HPN31945.1 M48 family metalloprotease [bacterium]